MLYSYNALGQPPTSIFAFGPLTHFGQRLTQLIQPGTTDSDNTSPILYVNSIAPLSPDEINDIKALLNAGSIVLLDSTVDYSGTIKELSTRIGGIGFNSTIVMIRKRPDGTPEFKELVWFSDTETNQKPTAEYLDFEAEQLAKECYRMLQPWLQRPRHRSGPKPGGKVPAWKPEVSIPIEIRQLGFPCMVGSRYEGNNVTGYSAWSDELIDACDNSASASFFYNVDLIRSSRSNKASHNAKYIRITMDPGSNAGAGWHLFFYQKYAPFSRKGMEHKLIQDITVDWDSSIFSAEIPISLEASIDTIDGACLTAPSLDNNDDAAISPCQFESNQIWGLDTEHRLRSFLAYNYCLNSNDNNTVSLHPCNHSAAQKWKWDDNTLSNPINGYLSISTEGRLMTRWNKAESTLWKSHIRKADITDALSIESLPSS
ncbi:cytolysin [Elysia marginata]|uniref:Cytolysin n=1 Tax=Elysia marginata TaxID=1093978 RepID=A0AAV4FSV2_9GAST|nr:cytolysin [Elysia marginata]